MGVGIDIRGAPMGGPTGMTDPDLSSDRFFLASRGQFLNATAFFADFHAFSVENRQPSRVISPILQATESIQQDRLGVPRTHIGDNSTHRKLVLARGSDRVNV